MADRKISDLTALTTPASGDYLPIVDISEVAAASKNKRVTIQSLFQGIPVNVGIGTSSILGKFSIQTLASTSSFSVRDATPVLGSTGVLLENWDTPDAANTVPFSIRASTFSFGTSSGGAYVERMGIDGSGSVGIGTSSPDTRLHVADGQIKVANSGAINPSIAFTGNGAGASGFQIGQRYNAQELFIYDTAALADRVVVDSSGRVGIGTASPTMLLDINNDTVRVRTARTPASAAATGATGEICWDADYIYVCTATNTWKRSALSTW